MANPRIVVDFVADTADFVRGVRNAESSSGAFASKLKGLGKVGIAAGATAAVGALVYTIKQGVSEYEEATKVAAQTNAVIKSTGGAANVSAKQVSELATSLMKKSGVDDEAIQSGENLLLTFTKVRNEAGRGNDIFNQATKVMLDMSVALGQDATQSAMQLGKALQDPIKGITALRRVGVTFSQAQVDQIKGLLDYKTAAKDAAAAQKAAAKELASAQADHAKALDAVATAQDRARAAGERLQAAQYEIGQTAQKTKEAQYALAQAGDKIKDAQYSLAQATQTVKDAQTTLIAKQREARNAQLALTEARRKARDELEALKNATLDAALGEEGAQLSRDRAAENLQKVMADATSTDLDRRQATYELERAERDLVNAHADRITSEKKLTDATAKGVDGSDQVIKAQQDIEDAQKAAVKAAQDVSKAQHAQAEAVQAVAAAEHARVKDVQALTAAQHDQVVAQQKLVDAQRNSVGATKDLADAQESVKTSSADIAAAQDAVAAAQKTTGKAVGSQSKLLKAQKIILHELNREFGGAAKAYGDTLPGQIKIAQESFNNWAGDLVAKSIPVIQQLIGWLRDHWPEIRKALASFWRDAKPTLQAIGDLVVAIFGLIRKHWGTIGPILQDAATVIGLYLRIIGGVIKLFADILRGDWSAAWDDLKGIAENALKAVGAVATFWKDWLMAIYGNLAMLIVHAVTDGLSALGTLAWDEIKHIGTVIDQKGKDIDAWANGIALGIKNGLAAGLRGVGMAAWEVINNVGAVPAQFAGKVIGWGSQLGVWIKQGLATGLIGIGTVAWDGIQRIWGALVSVAKTVIGWGAAVGGWIKDGVIAGFEGIGKALVNLVKAALNRVLKAWNALRIPGFTIPVPFAPDIHVPGIPLPNIDLLAKGGIVTRPTLAMIGERGPEAVVPLTGSSDAPIEVHVYIGDTELRGIVRTEVVTANNRTAQVLLAGAR